MYFPKKRYTTFWILLSVIEMPKQKFVFVLGEPQIEARELLGLKYWMNWSRGSYKYGCYVAEELCGADVLREIEDSIGAAPKGVYTAILPLEV